MPTEMQLMPELDFASNPDAWDFIKKGQHYCLFRSKTSRTVGGYTGPLILKQPIQACGVLFTLISPIDQLHAILESLKFSPVFNVIVRHKKGLHLISQNRHIIPLDAITPDELNQFDNRFNKRCTLGRIYQLSNAQTKSISSSLSQILTDSLVEIPSADQYVQIWNTLNPQLPSYVIGDTNIMLPDVGNILENDLDLSETLIHTLAYLSKHIPIHQIQPEQLTAQALSLLQYFREQDYPLTLARLNLLILKSSEETTNHLNPEEMQSFFLQITQDSPMDFFFNADKWALTATNRSTHTYQSTSPININHHTRVWSLEVCLSQGFWLHASQNPEDPAYFSRLLECLQHQKAPHAIIWFEQSLYLIDAEQECLFPTPTNDATLIELAKFLRLAQWEMDKLHGLPLSVGNVFYPEWPNTFHSQTDNPLPHFVERWNLMNPHLLAYHINDEFLITPDIGTTPLNDDTQTRTALIELFLRTGFIYINAHIPMSILVHEGKAVYAKPGFSIKSESFLDEHCRHDAMTTLTTFLKQSQGQQQKPNTFETINTLAYLSQFIPFDQIKPDYLTLTMLPVLHFFRLHAYPLTYQVVEMLSVISQYECIDVNDAQTQFKLSNIVRRYYTTPLMYFALHNEEAIVCKLLNTKPYREPGMLNAVNWEGNTALMLAIKQPRIVHILTAAGVNLNIRNRAGQNALDLASEITRSLESLSVLKLLYSEIANYSESAQMELLKNRGGFANVYQYTHFMFHDEIFLMLNHTKRNNAIWAKESSLRNQFERLKFDDDIRYFKSKSQCNNQETLPFHEVMKTLYQQLEKAKPLLLYGTAPLEARVKQFNNNCNAALKKSDEDLRHHPAPPPVTSFLFFVDNFEARYQGFKTKLRLLTATQRITESPCADESQYILLSHLKSDMNTSLTYGK